MIQLELPLFDIQMTEAQLMLATGMARSYKFVGVTGSHNSFYGLYWSRICGLMKRRKWNAIVVTCRDYKYKYTLNPNNETGISRRRVRS
jgi:hypothetical protein